MMKRRARDTSLHSLLLFQPDTDDIKRFARALNTEQYLHRNKVGQVIVTDARAVQEELRRLVRVWFESGQSIRRVFLLEPALNQAPIVFRAEVVPAPGNTARIRLEDLPNRRSGSNGKALSLFVHFLLNPDNQRLGGPCANCGDYFYKKTLRAKTLYCSIPCSHRGSSRDSNRNKRDDDRKDKLRRAQTLIEEFRKLRKAGEWKEFVHSKDPEISRNFLTRAERSEDVIAPPA